VNAATLKPSELGQSIWLDNITRDLLTSERSAATWTTFP